MDKKSNWGIELTPARPSPRRASARREALPQVEVPRIGEVLEAIEKLADQLRRMEAKIDAVEDRLGGVAEAVNGLTARKPAPERTTRDSAQTTPTASAERASRRIRDAAAAAVGPPEVG